jgi:phosphoesterase RecJ-like protein
MFAGTNEHTFGLARELVRAGADPAHCARNVYFGHSTAKMRLLGAALSNLQREGAVAWIWVTREQMQHLGARDEDCEGLVNYALSIRDVEVAAFLRELPDGRYRVSLRSKGKVNVAAVAESFGGGGHECASGFSLAGPLDAAVRRILAPLLPA